jgi:hypothetical protein
LSIHFSSSPCLVAASHRTIQFLLSNVCQDNNPFLNPATRQPIPAEDDRGIRNGLGSYKPVKNISEQCNAVQCKHSTGGHNQIYGRSDLYRFNYIMDPNCEFCGAKKQKLEHIYIECPQIQGLFANFEKQFRISPALTIPQMLTGADSRSSRTKLTHKRLRIFRKFVYD